MKKSIALLTAAAIFSSVSLFAQASDCPENVKPCPKKEAKKCEKAPARRAMKGNKPIRAPKEKKFVNAPKRFKMSAEKKAEFKKYRDTVAAYKKDQTPENKAALVALLNKRLDNNIAANKKRVEFMKKTAAAIEKKTAEMEANRDAEIEKMIKNIMNPSKRHPRAKRPDPKK